MAELRIVESNLAHIRINTVAVDCATDPRQKFGISDDLGNYPKRVRNRVPVCSGTVEEC